MGITLLVFAVTRVVPGGPIERMLNDALISGASGGREPRGIAGSVLSDAQLQQLRVYYGFDKPIFLSYVSWLEKVMVLDLGRSTRYNEPVWEAINRRFPVSIFYGIATLILTYAVCIPLGIWKAIRHNSYFDNVSSGFVFLGYAIPGYVVGIALLTYLRVAARLVPARRIRQRQLRAAERVGQDARRARATHVAALVVHGRQLRRDDIHDEELADGQPLGRLRTHGDRERPVVPAAPCSAMPCATA